MTSRKKTGPCCSSVVGGTELAKCLLWDRFSQSGASHDADPFGTYRTEHDGSVSFVQERIVCPRYVPCSSPEEVDKLVARVLMAAAKHANRYLVLSERLLRGTLWRLPEGKVWHRTSVKVEDMKLNGEGPAVAHSKALPMGTLVHIAGFPEDFGRLCYDCSGYGVSVIAVHRLSVFKVIPEVTLERTPVRLAP